MKPVENNTLRPDFEDHVSIGEAARILGVSVFTLRMYERAGLVISKKRPGGHRMYSPPDIDRLKCIRAAITEQKISIAGIQRIHSLIPCWQIVGCSESDRGNCEAFSGHLRGCWSFKHKENTCAGRDCRCCPVYTEFTDCGAIKKRIRLLTTNHESPLS